MINISYNTGCRNCLQTTPIREFYIIGEGDSKEIQKKSEFELMQMIEVLRREDNHKCQSCESANVEIYNIEVDGFKLYDFERILNDCTVNDILITKVIILKEGDQLKMNLGGSKYSKPRFLKKVGEELLNIVNKKPDSYYNEHEDGNLVFCMTGLDDLFGKNNFTRVESLRTAGISKENLQAILQPFVQQYASY